MVVAAAFPIGCSMLRRGPRWTRTTDLRASRRLAHTGEVGESSLIRGCDRRSAHTLGRVSAAEFLENPCPGRAPSALDDARNRRF